MKLFKRAAPWAITLPLAVLTACGPQIRYRLPPLNQADQQRLICPAPAGISQLVADLPDLVWLATSDGRVVRGPGGETWVTFASANAREGELIGRVNDEALPAHVACWDDVGWFADLWASEKLATDD